jgi:hypothetical protein
MRCASSVGVRRRAHAKIGSASGPSAKGGKPVAALLPQMGTVLIRPVFSSVTRALISHRLVMGKLPQNTLVRLLVHASRFDGYSAALSPFEAKSQFLYTTSRAVPSMAHR